MKTALAALAGLLCLLAGPAPASDWFVFVGAGQTTFPTYYEPGLWQMQDMGFAFVPDESSPAWSLGVGRKINKNLSVQLAYADLGKYNSFGRYTDDPGFLAQCAPGNCAPTATGWHRGSTQVLELSALYESHYLFGRAGLGYHLTKFRVIQSADNGDTQGRDAREIFPGQGFDDQEWHSVLGVGLHVGAFRLEQQWRSAIGGPGSGYHDARTVMLSAEVNF